MNESPLPSPTDRRRLLVGTVYLLHFGHPYKHARHYLGFSTRPEARIRQHCSGHGSPLVAAAVGCGFEIFVARRWKNVTRTFERRLHGYRRGARACPICRGPRVYRSCLPRRDPTTGIGI